MKPITTSGERWVPVTVLDPSLFPSDDGDSLKVNHAGAVVAVRLRDLIAYVPERLVVKSDK